MLPAVDPVTVVVVGFLVVFSVYNWLRWQSKLAWFRRVQIEHVGWDDEEGRRRLEEGRRLEDDGGRADDEGQQ